MTEQAEEEAGLGRLGGYTEPIHGKPGLQTHQPAYKLLQEAGKSTHEWATTDGKEVCAVQGAIGAPQSTGKALLGGPAFTTTFSPKDASSPPPRPRYYFKGVGV